MIDNVQSWLQEHRPTVTLVAVATLVALLAIVIAGRLVARSRIAAKVAGRRSRVVENGLTLVAAGVATGLSANGMWNFTSDTLHIDSPVLRGLLFAFFEIAMVVSAIRARRNLLDHADRLMADMKAARAALAAASSGAERDAANRLLAVLAAERPSTGVDGIAVWVFAVMTGVFSATDTSEPAEAGIRFVAPLVAAWLWERGMAADRRRHRRGAGQINWKISPERVLVALGLAESSGRAVGEVDAARRKARLARSAYRLHMLREAQAWSWRISLATWRLRRQILQGAEHLGLATDDAARNEVLEQLAMLYQVLQGTSPEAVADLAPWSKRINRHAAPPFAAVETPTEPVVRPALDAAPSWAGRGDDTAEEQASDVGEPRPDADASRRALADLRAILDREVRPADGNLSGRGVSQLARAYGPQVPTLEPHLVEAFVRDYMLHRAGLPAESGRDWEALLPTIAENDADTADVNGADLSDARDVGEAQPSEPRPAVVREPMSEPAGAEVGHRRELVPGPRAEVRPVSPAPASNQPVRVGSHSMVDRAGRALDLDVAKSGEEPAGRSGGVTATAGSKKEQLLTLLDAQVSAEDRRSVSELAAEFGPQVSGGGLHVDTARRVIRAWIKDRREATRSGDPRRGLRPVR